MGETQLNHKFSRGQDRRKRPTPFLSWYTFFGRRRGTRRDIDPRYNYYVDRLDRKTWAIIAIIIVLSVVDSLFTLYFLKKGYREVNPLMNITLLIGQPVFIAVKYFLTVLGVLVLGLHKNFIFVRELKYFLVILYLLLNSYHLYNYFK